LLIVVAILSFARTAVAQDGKPEFSLNIHGPESAKAGTYLAVDILVTNVSDHVIAFDDRGSRGAANFDIDVFDAEGNLAPRTDYGKWRRGEKLPPKAPGEPDTMFDATFSVISRNLKPGETLKDSAAITELYEMKPGKYTVSIWRPDFQTKGQQARISKGGDSDLFKPVPPNAAVIVNPPAQKPKAIAKSNTITIVIVE
jgi:hypothetical protein